MEPRPVAFLPPDLMCNLGLVIIGSAAAGHLLFLSFVPDTAKGRSPRLYLIPTGRYPDAVVVGIKKCGTQALAKSLSVHPRVLFANQEVHFFNKYFAKGFGWYSARLEEKVSRLNFSNKVSGSDALLMEKTPAYYVTPEARVGLKRGRLNAKVIVILCHPVKRVLSDIRMKVEMQGLKENYTGKEALDRVDVLDPVTKGVNPNSIFVDTGIYSQNLFLWMDAFSLGEELLILDRDNLKQRPMEELELVQDFLGIPRVVTSQDYYLNKSKGFYCLRHLGCLKDGKGHKDFSSLFGQDLQDKLADFYRPHNEALFQMLNRTFDWS